MSKMGAIILAAGKGTRMKSDLPKVLHKVAGKPLVSLVAQTMRKADIENLLLVVGHGAAEVQRVMGDDFLYTLQDPQLGTGHAVMVALPVLPTDIETIFVACGDTPLLSAGTLKAIDGLFSKTKAACTILTANMTNPFGYGRIIRDPLGHIKGIVEERDATEEEKKIAEINTGTYCFRADLLRQAAAELTSNNA